MTELYDRGFQRDMRYRSDLFREGEHIALHEGRVVAAASITAHRW
jgi:hypothetical protein